MNRISKIVDREIAATREKVEQNFSSILKTVSGPPIHLYQASTAIKAQQLASQSRRLQQKFRLQSDHTDFFAAFGSLAVRVNQHIWPRPKKRQIVPTWAWHSGFYIYGIDTPEGDLNLEQARDDMPESIDRFSQHMVPVMATVTEEYYFAKGNGSIVSVYEPEAGEIEEVEVCATFLEFIQANFEELREGLDDLKENNPFTQTYTQYMRRKAESE